MDDIDIFLLNGAWDAMTYTSAFERSLHLDPNRLNPDESVLQGLFSPRMTRYEALVRIDNKEQEHKELLLQLEHHWQALQIRRSSLALMAMRNALIAIRHLPNEILVDIFCLASHHAFTPRGVKHRSLMCVRLTHVCRHWRDVALSTPHLWCTIDFYSIGQGVTFLRRSKVAPFDVLLPDTLNGGKKGSQILKLMQENMWRCRRMKIDHYKGRWNPILPLLTMSAPRLDIFELFIRKPDIRPIPIFNILVDHIPVLHRLHLSNVHVPWNSGMFSASLTHLSVEYQLSIPSLERFFEILRICTQLIELQLRESGPAFPPPASTIPFTPLPPVRLPHLRTLMLNYIPINVRYLLSHLITASRIRVRWIFRDIGSFADLSVLLPQDVSSLAAFTGIRSLTFEHYSACIYMRCGHTSTLIDDNNELDLGIFHPNPLSIHSGLFASIGRAFPLPLLESLSIVTREASISTESWMEILSALPTIRNLHFGSGNLTPLLEALQQPILIMPGGSGFCVCAPRLRKLVATSCPLGQSTVNALFACLKFRISSCAPIHVLEFSSYSVGESVVVPNDASDDKLYMALSRVLVPGETNKITLDLLETFPQEHECSPNP